MAMFGFVCLWHLMAVLVVDIWLDFRADIVALSQSTRGSKAPIPRHFQSQSTAPTALLDHVIPVTASRPPAAHDGGPVELCGSRKSVCWVLRHPLPCSEKWPSTYRRNQGTPALWAEVWVMCFSSRAGKRCCVKR